MLTYAPSRFESVVTKLYKELDIFSASQINFEYIAESLGVFYSFAPIRSTAHIADKLIIIDERKDFLAQREDFAHELSHILIHAGSQLVFNDLFIELQEIQADKMSMYLLVPHDFLMEAIESGIQNTNELADYFRVTPLFMKRRLKHLENKMNSLKAEKEFAATLDKLPKFGRDYYSTWTVGRIEYFCDINGKILFHRIRADI